MVPTNERLSITHGLLRSMHVRQAAAFILACAERRLPAYERFSQVERWGSANTFRTILERCWARVLARDDPETADLEYDIKIAERLTPSTEHFANAFTGEAMLFGAVVRCCLYCFLEKSVKDAIAASVNSLSAVEDHVYFTAQQRGQSLSDEQLQRSRESLEEIALQEATARKILSVQELDAKTLRELAQVTTNEHAARVVVTPFIHRKCICLKPRDCSSFCGQGG